MFYFLIYSKINENYECFSENSGVKRDDQQVRRAAEREGRRIRRMKRREAKSIQKHIDGMSSDDEVTEMEAAAFKRQKGN